MDSVALVAREGSQTYGELMERVASLRSALSAHGVRHGDRVLVVCANEAESVAACHAVVTLGAVAVLTQVSAGAAERRVALEVSRPVLAVLSPRAAHLSVELGPHVRTVVSTDLEDSSTVDPVDGDPSAACVVVFTSGTTSGPKGVVHSKASLAAATECFRAATGLRSFDRLFLVSPLASITGVTQALGLAPVEGASVVLKADFEAERSLDLLLASGGTFYGGPDVVLDRLLAEAARRQVEVPLRLAALGGTMLRRDLVESAEERGIRVIRMYGSSEVPCSTSTRPDEPDELRLVDEGEPGPGVRVRLADDGSNELLIAGPHTFLGYLGEDGLEPSDEWFATGDEARFAAGRLKIVGRLKEMAIRNGQKVSLAEVDEAFARASGLKDAAAYVVPDPETGERVCVAAHLRAGEVLDVPAALASMGEAGLARYKLPESVVRRSEPLPVTATGKVQRRLLPGEGEVLWQAARLNQAPLSQEVNDGARS